MKICLAQEEGKHNQNSDETNGENRDTFEVADNIRVIRVKIGGGSTGSSNNAVGFCGAYGL